MHSWKSLDKHGVGVAELLWPEFLLARSGALEAEELIGVVLTAAHACLEYFRCA